MLLTGRIPRGQRNPGETSPSDGQGCLSPVRTRTGADLKSANKSLRITALTAARAAQRRLSCTLDPIESPSRAVAVDGSPIRRTNPSAAASICMNAALNASCCCSTGATFKAMSRCPRWRSTQLEPFEQNQLQPSGFSKPIHAREVRDAMISKLSNL